MELSLSVLYLKQPVQSGPEDVMVSVQQLILSGYDRYV